MQRGGLFDESSGYSVPPQNPYKAKLFYSDVLRKIISQRTNVKGNSEGEYYNMLQELHDEIHSKGFPGTGLLKHQQFLKENEKPEDPESGDECESADDKLENAESENEDSGSEETESEESENEETGSGESDSENEETMDNLAKKITQNGFATKNKSTDKKIPKQIIMDSNNKIVQRGYKRRFNSKEKAEELAKFEANLLEVTRRVRPRQVILQLIREHLRFRDEQTEKIRQSLQEHGMREQT